MLSLLLFAIAAPAAAPNTAAIDRSRQALVACFKQAASEAKPGEVTLDGFDAYAAGRCADQQKALTDAMVAFDVKNGVSRKSAAEGAQMAVEDYLYTARDMYAARMPK